MIGGVVIVIGLLFLGAQFMDASSTVSLASEFHIPANHEFTRWATLDRPRPCRLCTTSARQPYSLSWEAEFIDFDWLNEKLGCQFEAAPSGPANEPHPPALIIETVSAPVIDDRKSDEEMIRQSALETYSVTWRSSRALALRQRTPSRNYCVTLQRGSSWPAGFG